MGSGFVFLDTTQSGRLPNCGALAQALNEM
jgi:hypothetical protein